MEIFSLVLLLSIGELVSEIVDLVELCEIGDGQLKQQ